MCAFSPLDEVESSILLVFANTNPPLLCLTAFSNNADESCNCILMGRLERPETFRGKEEKKSKERTGTAVGTKSLLAGQRGPASPRKESRATHTRAWCEQTARGRQGPVSALSFPVCVSFWAEGGSLRLIISSKVRSQTGEDNVTAYLPISGAWRPPMSEGKDIPTSVMFRF